MQWRAGLLRLPRAGGRECLTTYAQVIRFEARGCGRSSAVPPYTIATCLADLEAIRQHYGVVRWIVGGHSAGADLALAYALHIS